jgi:hypothetical protein
VRRARLAAGLAAFALLAAALTFDQPRPRGSEIARDHVVGPAPPFGGAADTPHGCPRESLVRFGALETWLGSLPFSALLTRVAARELLARCAAFAGAA